MTVWDVFQSENVTLLCLFVGFEEIIKLLQDFSRVVKRAAENYDPSLIAKYAINLAQAFNKYYAHTRILDESPERESRLALSYSTAVVLKEALRLLGVDAPEKM